MATIRLYLDTRRAKRNGEFPIKIVVNHRKDIMINTPYSAKDKEWRNNRLTKAVPNFKAKNAKITKMISDIESKLLDLDRDDKLTALSDKQLKQILQTKRSDKPSLFIQTYKKYTDSRKAEQTRYLYDNTLKKILEFDAAPTFESINFEWLENFDAYLAQQGNATNTRAIEMRNIRAVFNYALKTDATNIYPFRKFDIKKEKTRHRDLEIEEIHEIIKYEGKWKHFTDCFMLSFYLVGINLKDLLYAKKTDVKKGRLEYYRNKTGRLYSIKIEPEAREIIDRYPDSEYLVSFCRMYQNYDGFKRAINYALKKITNQEGEIIDENMSTYYARHSWATIASKIDIPKDTISESLGHEYGSKITGIYINFDIEKVDPANRKVIDAIVEPIIKPKRKRKTKKETQS